MTKISKNQFIHNTKTAYLDLTNDRTKITYGNMPDKIRNLVIVKAPITTYGAQRVNLYDTIKCEVEVNINAS